MRWLVGSIVDWKALFKHAYNSLKPGGYIESHEASPYIVSDDGSIHETSAMNQWGKFFVEGGRKMGRSFTVVKDGTQRKAMEEAGFVDIEEANLKVCLRLDSFKQTIIISQGEVVNCNEKNRTLSAAGLEIPSSARLASIRNSRLSRTLRALCSSWQTRSAGPRWRLAYTPPTSGGSFGRGNSIPTSGRRSSGAGNPPLSVWQRQASSHLTGNAEQDIYEGPNVLPVLWREP